MAEYKLIYFNIRGAAEPIRYIFAYAGVDYDDSRVAREEWGALKPTMPWNQLPVLESQGRVLAQSTAIMRYLARKFNLTGKSDLEAARCDELIDALSDFRAECRKFLMASDPEKKAEFKQAVLEVHMPKYYGKFDNIIKSNPGGTHLVGDSITWTDLVVAVHVESVENSVGSPILNDYPNLKALKDKVNQIPNIKAWREKRPQTDM